MELNAGESWVKYTQHLLVRCNVKYCYLVEKDYCLTIILSIQVMLQLDNPNITCKFYEFSHEEFYIMASNLLLCMHVIILSLWKHSIIFKTYLAWNSMGFTDLVTPVAPPDWHDRELGKNNSTTDSSGHFLAALYTKTNVAIVVTDGNKGLKEKVY